MRAQTPRRRFLFEYTQAAIIAMIFALFVRTYLVQAFHIPSPSMEDSLLVGDHILVNKFALAPLSFPLERSLLPLAPIERGTVIVFRYPHDLRQDYIKRVIGLPGETLKIVHQVVYVREPGADGFVALLEPYSVHKDPQDVPPHLDNFGPVTIPEGEYFAMGDNRDDSLDSRDWGFVPRRDIIGRALLVYWSVADADGGGARAAGRDGSGSGPGLLEGAGALVRRTRWERTGLLIR